MLAEPWLPRRERGGPYVPAERVGNPSLLSVEKARAVLGYRPRPHGHYLPTDLVC